MNTDLPTRYEPQATERDIYARWMAADCFRAVADDNPLRYCVTIPPPNVTGALHLGHALNHTIMDVIARRKRMMGYNTLVLPGTDHGGISTQTVVEKQLKKNEGKTRVDLGREAFEGRVREWKDEYGDRIVSQLKRLGCGYDWHRLAYTMDAGYVDAIMTVFERLFDDGYIYLGERMINWSPALSTVISDIEVDNREETGSLWHFRYPLTDGSGEIVVATTRPETLLGDTAVAVAPDDERYAGVVGKTVTLPLVGRLIPVIADGFVAKEFGTGAVKVTPAHDPNDYEAGLRHNLPRIEVIGADARMTAAAGAEYEGLDRFEARAKVVRAMEDAGFLVKIEPYHHSVAYCDRSGIPVEPRVSEQWFCKMAGTTMVERALEAARADEINFVPARHKELFIRWLENLRDWPISRQLWWGHRMPVYYKPDGTFVVARTRAAAEAKAGTAELTQVDDVLDTWFSSALWPFATLGWNEDTPEAKRDLAYYYPTNALFTAQEILSLWVARMVMTGYEFTGEKPFDDVYIHATILDEHGRRMSKSKGNGIDPVDLIELYGADALRFALAREAGQRQDIRIKPIRAGKQEQVEQARNFAGKIWNASRFVLMNLGDDFAPVSGSPAPEMLADRWILARLSAAAESVNAAFEGYNLDDGARALYEFFWDDFCDWYVEAAKPRLQGDAPEGIRHLLYFVLERSLRLLHPIMPYLTEAIWQTLPGAQTYSGKAFLMFAPFPTAAVAPRDDAAENDFAILQEVVRAVRNLRSENNVKTVGEAFFAPTEPAAQSLLAAPENGALICSLARIERLVVGEPAGDALVAPTRFGAARIARPASSPEEIAAERARIERDLAKIAKDSDGIAARLGNAEFVQSAPPAVVEKARAQAAELSERQAKLSERLAQLR